MKKIDLIEILNGNIPRIDEVNVSDIALYEMDVLIYPNDVRRMLKKYLGGEITSEDLTHWAKFICLRGEYCPPECEDEDYYEDMFYVIQRLSTPEIDGEINIETVQGYLKELDKYSPNEI